MEDEMSKSESEENQKTKKSKKNKKNPVLFIIKFILILILVILIALAGWFCYSGINKKTVIKTLPQGYSVYMHMDSAWNAIEPLLDLKAADLVFSSGQMADLRSMFMDFRASKIRKNKLVSFVAGRPVDAAVYLNESNTPDFVAIVDLGFLSGATRPLPLAAPLVFPKLNVEGLSFNKESKMIEFVSGETNVFVKTFNNLIIASSKKELIEKAVSYDNDLTYTKEQRKVLAYKDNQAVRVIVDAKSLAKSATQGDPLLSQISEVIADDTLSVVSFKITNDDISLTAQLPVENTDERNESLNILLEHDSKTPALLSRMGADVQYYTLLNAGSLEELKNALFPLIPSDKNPEGLWNTGNSVCKSMLGVTMEDLLFSWTGNEYAVLGIENQNDPVFAIQVKDEDKRSEVFDKVLSSLILKEETSLILDGVRLPRIQLPSFLQNIIGLFNINLPNPYYMVQDGFVYFSLSSEALIKVHGAAQNNSHITKVENWKNVSTLQSNYSSISLYYNLERSIPFFLKSNANIAQALKLYSYGRSDLRIKDNNITFQLQAKAGELMDSRGVLGFPVNLEGKNNGKLYISSSSKNKSVFWVENEKTVKSMEIPGLKINSIELNDNVEITEVKNETNDAALWAVTQKGELYLFDKKLNIAEGFPLFLNEIPCAPVSSFNDSVIIPLENKTLCIVNTKKQIKNIELPLSGSVKSACAVNGNIKAVYDKSFAGKVILINGDECMYADTPLSVPGIAYGSPAIRMEEKNIYTGFITQNGNFYLWKNNELQENFPLKLEGVYYTNAVTDNEYFYVLSSDGKITRISCNGETLTIAIPFITAKNGYISVIKNEKNKVQLYVCSDSNLLYGFDQNLEMLYGFPVKGWGKPVFADVNGDRKADCFTLSMDKKIYAWNME